MTVLHSAPKIASNEGVLDTLTAALGPMVVAAREEYGEIVITVVRDRLEDALRLLRDSHEYQQLMEIAGVDYPSRPERFEVVYMLLSLTKNHRLLVKVNAAENTPVPTVTTLWPVAGWLEREVFDLYGVIFAGNQDLRRILTDYGFEGHPFRKDFPLTGYVELRYSEEDKRVVYEPVQLAQDLRSFDFMSPWEGADYVLPGDEKAPAASPPAPPSPAPPPVAPAPPPVETPKTTDKPADTGAGAETNKQAEVKVAKAKGAVPKTTKQAEPGAPDPTEDRPARKPRAKKGEQTETEPKKAPAKRATKPKAKPAGDDA
ncbi:NADH-quinone oxidoreductase subunit C [Novosphingobium sp. G106]|uniref:NADH-quinone oxidoreductase subunit C n=1 Tax=Novosphingobium sp. G106 TaxID=2849500 RepID=UPI001C2CF354|nr:NADH-quinone oxidoreductase subunit C [Novosphingobium sp. G106]MBV1687079.1 NADH-quinone oxidoreductase subunit C [Novosphingobium sp. G106]